MFSSFSVSRVNGLFDKDVEALAKAAQPKPKLDVPNVSLP